MKIITEIILAILAGLDLLILAGFSYARYWWEGHHNEPGLWEMISSGSLNTGIIVSGVVLVVLIIAMIVVFLLKESK